MSAMVSLSPVMNGLELISPSNHLSLSRAVAPALGGAVSESGRLRQGAAGPPGGAAG